MTTAMGRSAGDHVCWPFHGMDGLVATAREYAVEGLDRDERVAFLQLSPSGRRHAVVSDVGQLGVPPSAEVPLLTPLIADPDWRPWWDPVDSLRSMMDAAVADGHSGLRVFTDATEVARHPATREDWVHAEHLIDRYSPGQPLTVLCGYDAANLGEETVAEVACVHALTGGTPSPFLLHSAGVDGGLALAGEVDRGSATALYHAIIAIAPGTSHPVMLDVTEHEFIDHTGLVALHRAAGVLGTRMHVVGASSLTALLVDAFGLTRLSLLEASP
jgi:ABC-type transporter Mla MlaB component